MRHLMTVNTTHIVVGHILLNLLALYDLDMTMRLCDPASPHSPSSSFVSICRIVSRNFSSVLRVQVTVNPLIEA